MSSAQQLLPIEAIKDAFVQALSSGRPIVVSAPTGSGKSTRLPVWLLGCTRNRVWVVEPRRVACRALAQWVAAGQGESVGESVGYRVRFDDRTSPTSRVVFLTPGVALNLWAAKEIRPDDVVVVDEFHERSWEVDLFVALVLAASEPAQLVVCSATLDVDTLRERLDAISLESSGRTFDVRVEHLGGAMPSSEDLEERVAQAVSSACAAGAGDVLVFLPGKAEIERCGRAVDRTLGEVVPVHGGLEPRAMTRAFERASTRKIYLSTNVAETSLTLPGVDVVIDSGLARMRVHRSGRSVLALVPIAQSSMDQRAGRAGRVRAGRCIRLWDSRFIAEPTTAPEVERVELDELVLRAAMCGVHGDRLDALPWVTPPPAFAMADARRRLRVRGTLDEQGAPTQAGRMQARLPVSWFSARVLAGAPAPLRDQVAHIVALVEVGRDLIVDRGAEGLTELLEGARDEVQVQLRCLAWGDPRRHGLHGAALAEARRLARSLGAAKLEPPIADGPQWSELIDHMLRSVPEAAFVPRERKASKQRRPAAYGASKRPWGNGELELSLRDYVIPGLATDLQPKPARAGLVLDHEWLGSGRAARGVGRMLLRCELADLERAGLYEESATSPSLDKRRVMATLERRYAGVLLSSRTEVPSGRALCVAAAQLIVRGSLRKGLRDRLQDDLHRWRLWSAWAAAQDGPTLEPPPDDAVAFVSLRLESMGVGASEDLELVEDDDLAPDVEALGRQVGLGEREQARLVEEFPRQWAFPGGRCAVAVDFVARRVTLSPVRMDIKGDPPAKFLPRFRGFAVEFVKASRRQRLR